MVERKVVLIKGNLKALLLFCGNVWGWKSSHKGGVLFCFKFVGSKKSSVYFAAFLKISLLSVLVM